MQLYLRDVLPEPLLSAQDEIALGRRARRGDGMARERLVLGNLRLVMRLAYEYQGLGLPVADLISEGNIGLMIAAERFNPDLGARFATYAVVWIKQRIRRALSNQSRVVRLPMGVVECVARVKVAETRLRAELGRTPTDDELAQDTDLVRDLIHRLRGTAMQSYVSLDTVACPHEDGLSLAETLADEVAETPDMTLMRRDEHTMLAELLCTLEPREARILRLRYGLEDGQERSLEEVGNVLGLVRQRVQQIEAAALTRLRKRARLTTVHGLDRGAVLRPNLQEASN